MASSICLRNCHSRPPLAGRNGSNKPLDSGFRRNDEALVAPRLHSSESSPAWMQVAEPRWEQAAEESKRAAARYQRDPGFGQKDGLKDGIACPCCHSRPPSANGNGLNRPLDSGLRRNDEAPVVTSSSAAGGNDTKKQRLSGCAAIAPLSFQRKLESMPTGM